MSIHSKRLSIGLPKGATRIKICGNTCEADALMACEAGADAIGLVFYEPSPRYVSIATARRIAYAVGPFVAVVGLFVNASKTVVDDVLEQVPLHVLQFHGDETAAFCEQFARPFIKAIRMRDGIDLRDEMAAQPKALAFLLDTYRKTKEAEQFVRRQHKPVFLKHS